MEYSFDVFISYNSDDHGSVVDVARRLKSRGVRVWLDEWELRPGLNWMNALDEALAQCEAVAVFLSGSGVGPWQDAEIFGALEDHAKKNLPVIPVILPGSDRDAIKQNIPRFLRRYTAVDFSGGLGDERAMERLTWGITGRPPSMTPKGPIPEEAGPRGGLQPSSAALGQLRSCLSSDNITFFVGRDASIGGEALPSDAEIVRQLIAELQEAEERVDAGNGRQNRALLPRLSTIGDYFAVKETERGLENRLAGLMGRTADVPPSFATLAELLRLLMDRPRRRRRHEARQLVVTTNLDTLLERALLTGGVPYTRLVQHRAGARLVIHAYDRVLVQDEYIEVEDLEGHRERVDRDDLDGLLDLIEHFGVVSTDGDLGTIMDRRSSGTDTIRPVLYKFRGSSDVPGSCAISTDHLIRVAANAMLPDSVPVQVMETIASTPMLFFGYGPLDPELRLMVHTVLSEAFSRADDPQDKFVLKRPRESGEGFDYVEARIWAQVKLFCTRAGISIIEEQADEFLADLVELVREDIQP